MSGEDWGQGAANNTVGWGQGAANGAPWGAIHELSWGHPRTNLVGSLFDPDYQAVLNYAATQGITTPSQEYNQAISDFIAGLREDRLYPSKCEGLWVLFGDGSNEFKYINIPQVERATTITPTITNTVNGNTSDDVSGTVLTSHRFDWSIFRNNSASLFTWIEARPSADADWFGIFNVNSRYVSIGDSGSRGFGIRLMSATAVTPTVLQTLPQSMVGGTHDGTNVRVYKNENLVGTTAQTPQSEVALSYNSHLHSVTSSTGIAANYCNNTIGIHWVGSFLTDEEVALLSARMAALRAAINALLPLTLPFILS
jgi:hypothetical protein